MCSGISARLLCQLFLRQWTQAANEDDQIPDRTGRFPLCTTPRWHPSKQNPIFDDVVKFPIAQLLADASTQVWHSRVEIQPHFGLPAAINAMAN
jgi:hypothetical protein